MKRYLLRFHLGFGKNYFKWRLEDRQNNKVEFLDDTRNFILYGCRLKNNKNSAEKIFNGSNKIVCSFVEFDYYEEAETIEGTSPILYNPRIAPYWRLDGKDVDGLKFEKLYTFERRIYLK